MRQSPDLSITIANLRDRFEPVTYRTLDRYANKTRSFFYNRRDSKHPGDWICYRIINFYSRSTSSVPLRAHTTQNVPTVCNWLHVRKDPSIGRTLLYLFPDSRTRRPNIKAHHWKTFLANLPMCATRSAHLFNLLIVMKFTGTYGPHFSSRNFLFSQVNSGIWCRVLC